MKRKLKGFTLVELVITIAIVIILSVVSVPIYRGYTRNAKMSEAYGLLGTILSAQKAYFSQYGNFLRSHKSSAKADIYTCNEEVLGVDARGNKYFTCFFVGGENTANSEFFSYYFSAAVTVPDEFSSAIGTRLWLQYNITKGSQLGSNKLSAEWYQE